MAAAGLVIAKQLKAYAVGFFYFHKIARIYLLHNASQQMISVFASARYVQGQIDLCKCLYPLHVFNRYMRRLPEPLQRRLPQQW